MSSFRFGSHLPVLYKVISLTNGPIVEFGSGMNSTVFLHWMCSDKERPFVTFESKKEYFRAIRRLNCDWHKIIYVDNWDTINIAQNYYSVALVDQSPGYRRGMVIKYLTDVDYVVIHDSEPEHEEDYRYPEIYPLFKYRFDYTKVYPNTTVLSNKHDLFNLM